MILEKNRFLYLFCLMVISFCGNVFSEPPKSDSLISIAAVGDVMMGTTYPPDTTVTPPNFRRFLPRNHGKHLFEQVTADLKSTDITFCNLEGPLLDGGTPRKECKDPDNCYIFRTPEKYIKNLIEAGFNLFSLANNHARDFKEGMKSTMMLLDSIRMAHSGQFGDVAVISVKGLKVGMLAFAPYDGLHDLLDLPLAEKLVRELAARTDLVIISMHGGAEGARFTHVPDTLEIFHGEERGHLRKFARRAIDAGADLVLGHGPHVPRAMEIYNNRLIAYSLGNFCTYERFNLKGPNGLTFILQVSLNRKGEFVQGKIVPCRQIDQGIPVPDPQRAVISLLNNLARTDFPESGVSVGPNGVLVPAAGKKTAVK